MGLIKEPLDIDFLVDPRPLTTEEKQAISDFIAADKAKHRKQRKSVIAKPVRKTSQSA